MVESDEDVASLPCSIDSIDRESEEDRGAMAARRQIDQSVFDTPRQAVGDRWPLPEKGRVGFPR